MAARCGVRVRVRVLEPGEFALRAGPSAELPPVVEQELVPAPVPGGDRWVTEHQVGSEPRVAVGPQGVAVGDPDITVVGERGTGQGDVHRVGVTVLTASDEIGAGSGHTRCAAP